MSIHTLQDLCYAYAVADPVREMLFALQDRITELEAQRRPLTGEQADQIISGLQTCHHQSSKREFLKVWLRDWAAHNIKDVK